MFNNVGCLIDEVWCLHMLSNATFIKLQCYTSEVYLQLLILDVTESTLPALSIELIRISQSVQGSLGPWCC